MSNIDSLDRAVANLGGRRVFRHDAMVLTIASLVREADWRPLKAPWWRGKSACIIGSDLEGNFFLRHCDGSVRYWHHAEKRDIVVALSVKEFARRIEDDVQPEMTIKIGSGELDN